MSVKEKKTKDNLKVHKWEAGFINYIHIPWNGIIMQLLRRMSQCYL